MDSNALKDKMGFTAEELSDNLNILRHNVSRELNDLFRQGKLIKIKTRPVLFIDKAAIERIFHVKMPSGPMAIKSFSELSKENIAVASDWCPFDNLIGAQSSLKNQIEQAKAAIFYPPNGLHTLILGQTGVGKTLFATMMYNHAKYINKLDDKAPFIVFNCADYYNNPQLLLSHLFGHIKGSYTGANTDKAGIVENADGGILFLDEIHRLPPEGQEMLFYFMDTGNFNRLGETERNRKARVLIIGATTEDPNSSLLKTFVRRIPIIINIPNFDERPAKEKIDFVKFLFSNEAHRLNKMIKIEDEAVKALIGSTNSGNIGQMKSNIQLLCAKGFLNSMNDTNDHILIDLQSMPSEIKKGLFYLSRKRKELEEISAILDTQLVVGPEVYNEINEDIFDDSPFNMYKLIENKAAILKSEGANDEFINNFITTDINIHLKSFYNKVIDVEDGRNKLLRIVNENIIEFAEEIMEVVESKLERKLSMNFLYAFSLHLSSFLNRVSDRKSLKYTNINGLVDDKKNEYTISLHIKKLIEERFHVTVPKIEVVYLTLLISSITEEQPNQYVSIIVAAHGSSTASSMVSVAKQLLNEGCIRAIDMPLEVSPSQILDEIINAVKEIDMGKGILLLVDMGSLENFESIIEEKTGIRVKTINMVSTALVLEATRKSTMGDINLDSLHNSLKYFRGYTPPNDESINRDRHKTQAIVTICASGEGIATKLKALVEKILIASNNDYVDIVPISINDIEESVKKINSEYNVLASIGIMDPNIDVPHISLEEFIAGDGEHILLSILQSEIPDHSIQNSIIAEDITQETLEQFLIYLNPSKIIASLNYFTNELEKNLKVNFDNAMKIRMMVHLGCALERMVINEGLEYEGDLGAQNSSTFVVLKKASSVFLDQLNIHLTDDELLYLHKIISDYVISNQNSPVTI